MSCTFTSLDCGYLKINSVWATVADLTIFRNGTVDFDYHCFDGNPHDPGEMTAITLAILHDDDRGGEAARYPHLSFLFSIARAALEQGLSVELHSNDPSNAYWRIKDEVAVTNPGRPEHGTIRVTDDGALWWRCQLRDQPTGTSGLDLTEITSSITRAIGSAQVAKCEETTCPHASAERLPLPTVAAWAHRPLARFLFAYALAYAYVVAVPVVMSFREFRAGLAGVLDRVRRSPADVVYVGSHRRAEAVLVSVEQYEALVETSERQHAVATALASVRAEGLEPGADDLALFVQVASGELTTDELRERVLSRYRR